MSDRLPTLFIGSSTEALRVARAAKEQLGQVAEVTLWTEGRKYKKVGEFFLDSLAEASSQFDFALLIFSGDDEITIRQTRQHIVRDNVLFELGLFWSRLGRHRTFVLAPTASGEKHRILSDLQGLTLPEYEPARSAKAVSAAIKTACDQLALRVRSLGCRDVSLAPRAVVDVALPLADLMRTARQSEAQVVIRNIGLDLESTWPLVRDKILLDSAIESVTWHSLMIDAESPEFQRMSSDTVSVHTAQHTAAAIRKFCSEHAEELARRNIDFACRCYPSPSPQHGFLFNDDTLFLSMCAVDTGRLVGAPNPYLQIKRPMGGPSDPASAHLVAAFASWFGHLWATGSSAVWPLTGDHP